MTTHPHPEPSEEASSLPPYIYGHETSGMEKVWTEASVRTLKAERDEALTKLHALQALREAEIPSPSLLAELGDGRKVYGYTAREVKAIVAALSSAKREAEPLTPDQANNVWRRWIAAGHVQCDWLSLLRLTEAAHGITAASQVEQP